MKIDVEVDAIAIDPEGKAPVVILKEKGGERTLPIWIGLMEAAAIATELERISFERPMTHDLCVHVIDALGAHLDEVEVVDLRDNTFFAVLRLYTQEGMVEVDARPSDAIALALRSRARIAVESRVFDQVAGGEGAAEPEPEPVAQEGEAPSEKQRLAELLERLDPEAFKYKM